MQSKSFEDQIQTILERDKRYSIEAYCFVREVLDFMHESVSSGDKRHVTGQQLLEGIREFGLSQYGPLTAFVLDEWGVKRCEDFGEMVFNMIDAEILSKTPTDSKDHFKGGYDFETVFRKPFVPSAKSSKVSATNERGEKTGDVDLTGSSAS